MADLSEKELLTLYYNFVYYRDKYCNGWAKMSIESFFNKYGLNEYKVLYYENNR
jgi:hypothetical protein